MPRSRRKKLPVWTVRWSKDLSRWVIKHSKGLAVSTTKAWAIGWGLKAVLAAREPGPVSVRIYSKDGRIQEERTYPKRADPKRSKG
jgi:hypothetical protein